MNEVNAIDCNKKKVTQNEQGFLIWVTGHREIDRMARGVQRGVSEPFVRFDRCECYRYMFPCYARTTICAN